VKFESEKFKGRPKVCEKRYSLRYRKGGGFGRVVSSTEQVILELLAKVGLIFTLAY
jgi:hypothetical protein